MFTLRRTCLAVLILLAAIAATAQPAGPETLTRKGANAPFFVSATSATDADGSLRLAAFDEGTKQLLRAKRPEKETVAATSHSTSTHEPCATSAIHLYQVSGDVSSLDAMKLNARAIYRGRIVALTPGFDMGNPSTVITLQVTNAVRRAVNFPSSGQIHVIYPQASFSIGGSQYCNAGPIRDFSPAIGDNVLLFAYDAPRDATGSFLLTLPQQIIFERGARLYAARPVGNQPGFARLTLRDLETSVSSVERRDGEK